MVLKKLICLLEPKVIDGAVRYPNEGVISIDTATAERYLEEGSALSADFDPDEVGGEDLESMTVASLRQVAAAEEIDLSGATSKAQILAKIAAARADRPGQE